MKKLFTLMTLLVAIVTGAKAENTLTATYTQVVDVLTWAGITPNIGKSSSEEQSASGDHLIFKNPKGSSKTIALSQDKSEGDWYFSIQVANQKIYVEVPSAESKGNIKVVAKATADRYVTLKSGKRIYMNTAGESANFTKNDIEEVDGKYYVVLSHGSGQCKIISKSEDETEAKTGIQVTLNSFVPEQVTLGTNGYSTFAGEGNFTVTGATAYTASVDGSTVTLSSCDADAIIAAGQGIVLKGTQGAKATITYTTEAATVTSTGLEGVISSTESIPAANNMYVVASNGATTAFVKAPTDVTKAQMLNKAYLAAAGGGGLSALPINFGEVTAVQNVVAAPVANKAEVKKAFVNGQLVIITENGMVNALGQAVK